MSEPERRAARANGAPVDSTAHPPEARVTAHEALAPALAEMVAAVRSTVERVVATGTKPRRARPARGRVAEPSGASAVSGDPAEAVHDFRVAVRRLRSVLRPLRRSYGRRKLKAIGAGLRRYSDATGALRDEEVLRETLRDLELSPVLRAEVDAWAPRRARRERALRGAAVRLLEAERSTRLARELAKVEAVLARGPKRGGPLAAAASRAIEQALHDLGLRGTSDAGSIELAGLEPRDGVAMHELRIRFKRLRYTAELFAPLLGADPLAARAAALAKVAARMQKRLGELHDLDEAIVKIARAWGLAQTHRAELCAALASARERAADRAMTELARVSPELG